MAIIEISEYAEWKLFERVGQRLERVLGDYWKKKSTDWISTTTGI
ncbi:catalase [Pseudomonas monteilii]|uniref:Catalase n=1 Tax=Pseudomonas monteilii TaxID=76759 RepID=A0AAE6RCE1_9PSED|nr:catalase [Pseudomonas monteilii]